MLEEFKSLKLPLAHKGVIFEFDLAGSHEARVSVVELSARHGSNALQTGFLVGAVVDNASRKTLGDATSIDGGPKGIALYVTCLLF